MQALFEALRALSLAQQAYKKDRDAQMVRLSWDPSNRNSTLSVGPLRYSFLPDTRFDPLHTVVQNGRLRPALPVSSAYQHTAPHVYAFDKAVLQVCEALDGMGPCEAYGYHDLGVILTSSIHMQIYDQQFLPYLLDQTLDLSNHQTYSLRIAPTPSAHEKLHAAVEQASILWIEEDTMEGLLWRKANPQHLPLVLYTHAPYALVVAQSPQPVLLDIVRWI